METSKTIESDIEVDTKSYQDELNEIRRIRQEKYSKLLEKSTPPKPQYNLDSRKSTLDHIKKIMKSEVLRERMDKIEKQELKNMISKVVPDDLDYFSPHDLDLQFMINLFKSNSNSVVLSKAYSKSLIFPSPHILMIKELLDKPKSVIDENFLLKLLSDYFVINSNPINIITTTNLLNTDFVLAQSIVLTQFYNDSNTPSISFEQLRYIYSNTSKTISPEEFKFLVLKCSNKQCYSKCSKTFVERSNISLLKNLIHDVESKHKCKLDLDLYN